MKLIFIILLLTTLNAQDSLFWFNMKSVRDSIPETPRILDNIFGGINFDILDSLRVNRSMSIDGYRLQIYESSSATQASIKNKKFNKILSDSIYLSFEAPFYKLHYGNFISKDEAELEKNILSKKGLKNIWIVRSRIEK